jgi:hypothetical protein
MGISVKRLTLAHFSAIFSCICLPTVLIWRRSHKSIHVKNMKTTTRSIVAKLLCPPLTTIAIVSFALQSASAETDTWSGGGDGTSWNQAANWSDNNSAAPVNGDSLVFGNVAGSTLNDNLGGALTTYGISFSQSGYTLNTGNASSIFLSGQSVGYETGIYNGSGGFNTVNLNLNLDWGYYTFADYSGNGFALNGTLTPNKGGVAYFYANGAPITSTSLTTDSSGLIAGLGGAGLMFNGASPNAAVPTGLATVSGGDIVAYMAQCRFDRWGHRSHRRRLRRQY